MGQGPSAWTPELSLPQQRAIPGAREQSSPFDARMLQWLRKQAALTARLFDADYVGFTHGREEHRAQQMTVLSIHTIRGVPETGGELLPWRDELLRHEAADDSPSGLRVGAQLMGVCVPTLEGSGGELWVGRFNEGRPWQATDHRHFDAFAGHLVEAAERVVAAHTDAVKQRAALTAQGVQLDLLGGASLDATFAGIAESVRSLVDADICSIALKDCDDLLVRVSSGAEAPSFRGRRFPIDSSVAGSVFTTGETSHFADITADARTRLDIAGGETRLGPTLMVPLRSAETTLGVIAVARERGRDTFTLQETAILESFAIQVVMSIQAAESRERELAAHQRELRLADALGLQERIAGELFGVLQSLHAALRGSSGQTTGLLAGAAEHLDQTLSELRMASTRRSQD